MRFALLILFFGLLACQQEKDETQAVAFDPLAYVDPFIGTGFHGHTFPGPTLPFGMVQLSPDTHIPGWDASSGYHYADSVIYGFSHTHLSGTGIGDMGDVLLLPFTGEIHDSLIAHFDKSEEEASPGYYKVKLNNFDVTAELGATLRTGIHRYTFPEGQEQQVMLDLGHILQPNWGHRSINCKMTVIDNQTIIGERLSSGWANDHPVYFYAKFSRPFDLKQVTNEGQAISTESIEGKAVKAFLSFGSENEELLLKIGISPVSREGAKLNLEKELAHWDFDQAVTDAKTAWRDALNVIQVESQEKSVLTNFYTALYHSMMAPMLAQDVNGQYRGMDKEIHQAENGFTNYTVFSLWDTFRAWHPLMTIIAPEKAGQWVQALLRKYEEGGILPKWPLASNYTGTMVGYPATSVIADAMAKDITGFDQALALEAALVSSSYRPDLIEKITEPRAEQVMPKHLKFVNTQAYIPADSIGQSVSYGLECAYYDWCIAQIAKKNGQDSIANVYLERAKHYQNYFDPSTGFMRGRMANGSWKAPFNPFYSDHNNSEYVEGNAWQWSWFVPHDVEGFMELLGGKEGFVLKLDSLFSASSKIEGEHASADITGLIGQYAHGNEPSHHVAYFYNYIGEPEKTQKLIDQILQTLYTPTPEGISGNEDCGQMSAWYVLNALGFYQLCPGDPTYTIGRPLIDKAKIKINGGQFEIEVINNSLNNKFVEKMEINGAPLAEPFFKHEDLKAGGSLKIWMRQ